MPTIAGIHHVTAIASDPQRNLDFFTKVLGLRLVKLTVNFDDPGTYHFYFGDDAAAPGTILTFFPWPMAKRGRLGSGYQTSTAFAVPRGSLAWWRARLDGKAAGLTTIGERFGEKLITFEDPDGMAFDLVESVDAGAASPANDVPAAVAIRGFHSATLSQEGHEATSSLLTKVFGMSPAGQEGNRFRYTVAGDAGIGRHVDVLCTPDLSRGKLGAGIVHHLAFRARNDAEQGEWRRLLAAAGQNVTPVLDRSYFHSIYFREPGGVLFEIATDNPGFATDERPAELGETLKLPNMYEPRRAVIEGVLPRITLPGGKVVGKR